MLTRSGDNRLYVVPTTHETLASISRWQETIPQVVIVAPLAAGANTPADLLTLIKSVTSNRPDIVISFSDQLVSAEHAPLLIEHKGQAQYISGMEAVAHVGYGLKS
jgi:ADP-heptose:LPS heptosyltransferase